MAKKEIQNILAENAKGEIVFVGDVQSGRKGYFCLGCKREMQAVKSKSLNRDSYFRHDAEAMKGQQKCTFKDETIRHKRAKEILQIEKQIRVPALYKYPPNGEGVAILINQSKSIRAHSVSIELGFYEDENCQIKWGKDLSIDEKNLLIRPDVTFFDNDNRPILFIEIVVSHKIDETKMIKLKRLGIDTVSVTVPKSSQEEIDKLFHTTKHTNWVYNYEQEIFEYIPISKSTSERIFSSDKLPESVFRESFKCRATQIRGLIQRVKKCLGTELHLQTERDFESEIQRVERATKKIQSELRDYTVKCEEEWRESTFGKISKIENEEGILRSQEIEFYERYSDLEKRYFEKRKILEREEGRILEESNAISGEIGENRTDLDFRKSEIERRRIEVRKASNRERETIKNFEQRRKELPNQFEQDEESRRIAFERSRKFYQEREEEIRRKDVELQEYFRIEERRIGEDFENRKREIITKIHFGEFSGLEFSEGRFNPVVQGRELLEDFKNSVQLLRRSRKAWESFKSGAYKNWKN